MNTEMSQPTFGHLDVSIPEATYEAGKVSTVNILIRNPFNEPVEIIGIKGPKSSHLKEIAKTHKPKEEESITEQVIQKHPFWEQFKKYFKQNWSGILFTEVDVTFSGIQLECVKDQKVLNIRTKEEASLELEHELDSFCIVNIDAEKSSNIKLMSPCTDDAEKPLKHEDKLIIAPHCEVVAYFNVSTTNWLFFTPTRQTLNTQIEYRIAGCKRSQVISSGFDIKPPLKAMVIGSTLGGILGTVARLLTLPESEPFLISIGASIVMSLIATIALSRKTGSQGFITVEDFFGGFVIGALIGYGGPEYFERAIAPEDTP
jgi:hypothetical protein